MLFGMGMGSFKEINVGIYINSVAKGEIGFSSSRHDPTFTSALWMNKVG